MLREERCLTPVFTVFSVKDGRVTVTPLLPVSIFALPWANCQDKFKVKQSGKTTQTTTQVWSDKYELLLKSNGWGARGESVLKTG